MDSPNNNHTEPCSPKKGTSRPEFFLHIIKSSTALTGSNHQEQPQTDQLQSKENYSEENFEIESARQKFKEIAESIDNEERTLKMLEERRQKLEEDMERLQRDIEAEKEVFRQKIDADFNRNASQRSDASSEDLNSMKGISGIDPLSINTEEVEDRLREYREAVEDSQLQSILHEDDADIKRLRENLATYKRTLTETRKEQIIKQKRKSAAKIFQKHLEEVDVKCNEQISKLTSIQKSIGGVNAGTIDTGEGMNS